MTNDQKIGLLKAASHPQRIAILELLTTSAGAGEKMTVSQLHTALNIPQAIASQHLITLKDRGILSNQKDGTRIYYAVSDEFQASVSKLLAFYQSI